MNGTQTQQAATARPASFRVPLEPQGAPWQSTSLLDIVWVTAVQPEYDAAKTALEECQAEFHTDPDHDDRIFWCLPAITVGGKFQPLVLGALVRCAAMGPISSAVTAASFAARFQPTILAMTGVCAGVPGKTKQGQVVIGNQFLFDEKLKVIRSNSGRLQLKHGFEELHAPTCTPLNLTTEVLASVWPRVRDDARPTPAGGRDCWLGGPRTAFGPPMKRRLARKLKGYSLATAVAKAKTTADLTENQIKGIDEVIFGYDRYEVPPAPPGDRDVASTPYVNATGEIEGSEFKRTVVAVEMEGFSLCRAATFNTVPHLTFLKGVQDHADEFKDDVFRDYACHAPARLLARALKDSLERWQLKRLKGLLTLLHVPAPLVVPEAAWPLAGRVLSGPPAVSVIVNATLAALEPVLLRHHSRSHWGQVLSCQDLKDFVKNPRAKRGGARILVFLEGRSVAEEVALALANVVGTTTPHAHLVICLAAREADRDLQSRVLSPAADEEAARDYILTALKNMGFAPTVEGLSDFSREDLASFLWRLAEFTGWQDPNPTFLNRLESFVAHAQVTITKRPGQGTSYRRDKRLLQRLTSILDFALSSANWDDLCESLEQF